MRNLRSVRWSNAALVALVLVLPVFAVAHGDDPVLVELGSRRERASTVLERFDIAIRGMVMGQGGEFSPEVMEQLYPFLPQFLEQRAVELVLLEQARLRGVVADEDALEAMLENARSQFPDEASFLEVVTGAGYRDVEHLRDMVRETEVVDALVVALEAEVVLTELELRVAYEALKPQLVQPQQVCARHILVEEELGAGALARAARGGADFARLASTASIDRGSAVRGGDLGCFEQGVMVPQFEVAAFAAEVGVATDPVQSAFGFHVILVYERVPSRLLTLEEIREPLEEQLRAERVGITIDAILEASGVRTYPERIPTFEEAFGVAD